MKKLFLALISFFSACAGEAPKNIGVSEDRLAPCPRSPNCVSSFEADEQHHIEPLRASLREVEQVLIRLTEANIVSASENYLYAEFTSHIMKYVDDVEFLYDQKAGVTHVRSASRMGYSDLGINRKRIENIRELIRFLPRD